MFGGIQKRREQEQKAQNPYFKYRTETLLLSRVNTVLFGGKSTKINEEWRTKSEEFDEKVLKNTISGTNYHLQGTIYRLIRSIIRWEVDALRRGGFALWLMAMAVAMEFESQELQHGSVAIESGRVCWTPLPLAILFRAVVEGVSKIKLGADYADYTDLYFKFIPDHTLDK